MADVEGEPQLSLVASTHTDTKTHKISPSHSPSLAHTHRETFNYITLTPRLTHQSPPFEALCSPCALFFLRRGVSDSRDLVGTQARGPTSSEQTETVRLFTRGLLTCSSRYVQPAVEGGRAYDATIDLGCQDFAEGANENG